MHLVKKFNHDFSSLETPTSISPPPKKCSKILFKSFQIPLNIWHKISQLQLFKGLEDFNLAWDSDFYSF